MENSLPYTLFIRDFAENILLSLNMNYRSYIDFSKKDSVLKSKIDYENIEHTITQLAYYLLINGKQIIYFYEKNHKIVVSLIYFEHEKMIGKEKLKFPNKVMTNSKRKKILRKLKKMNHPKIDERVDDNYPRNSLFIMDLIRNESDKLTKDFSSISNAKKGTDQYTLYREIRKRKYQKILINYIFDALNKNFHLFLNILDYDDNIIFISQSIDELNILEDELINNKKTVDEVLKILYPSRT